MTSKFCGNCGAPQVAGAAFCPSCGAPAPGAVSEQPPHAGAAPAPGHAGTPQASGMSRKTVIGIAVVFVLAVVIALFVQRSERDFQAARRAAQASAASNATAPSPPPAQAGNAPPRTPYGGYNSGGTPGTQGWVRNQLIGRWSARDCAAATFEFRADGSSLAEAGGESLVGHWSLQDSRLTVTEPNATTILEIVEMGDEMITESQGRRQIWRRC